MAPNGARASARGAGNASVSSKSFGVMASAAAIALAVLTVCFATLRVHLKGGNQCEMTWSRPSYRPMATATTNSSTTDATDCYRLLHYVDGFSGFTAESPPKFDPDRLPLLFVPGHLGSHLQVRSLGVTMVELEAPIDVYTLDFTHTVTAVHGSLLWEQASHIVDAIAAIRAQYPAPAPPVTIAAAAWRV
eukprot:TRINITY_DN10125_c0_g1_i1.p1 TRINITY_DN10125_c0_g1~~TRINITY_DN10125_c0_g1_i1.p1  ORF type:complete len:190 (+),score=26.12 TRINITY_DN10125_c0_g1_i1:175-744(+)